ncbi:MAG TPA: hypothetical protein VK465_01430, partial [Fibrobacteria bacterium]|nr:hypothetical protein [Fibrobacteria bacterium]
IRLVEALTDSELETSIKRLGLEKEFFEVLEEITEKEFTSFSVALARRPDSTRYLARQMIAANFCIYPGAKKKILRLSFHNLGIFALEPQVRKTPAAQLAWDLRRAHGI